MTRLPRTRSEDNEYEIRWASYLGTVVPLGGHSWTWPLRLGAFSTGWNFPCLETDPGPLDAPIERDHV